MEKELGGDDILAQFKENFEAFMDCEGDNRAKWKEDKEFTWEDDAQWDKGEADNRKNCIPPRPVVTNNKCQVFVRQVVNDLLQNEIAIKIRPMDDKADPKTAKIVQGMIKHIEKISKAKIANKTAFEDSVAAGLGYIRVITEYEAEDSFNQEVKIKAVPNTLSCFLDHNHTELDGSDAEWGGFFERVSKTQFKNENPGVEPKDIDACGYEDNLSFWGDKDTVLQAEYFYTEYKPETLYYFAQGVTKWESDLKAVPELKAQALGSRRSERKFVRWCKLGAGKVLLRRDWPCKWIPIVPVYGRLTVIEGKKTMRGLTRYAKGAQKVHNYSYSMAVEKLALAPIAPYIGAEGQFEGHEKEWREMNIRRRPYMQYKPTSFEGNLNPPPHRTDPISTDPGIMQMIVSSSDEMKATIGMYDASIGKQGRAISGVAIRSQKAEGDNANYDFTDNLMISEAQIGRIIVELIPKVYDTARAVRILGEDDAEEIVRINEAHVKDGQEVLYDLQTGKYDVEVSAGPSYGTMREEARESMLQFIQAVPQAGGLTMDLFAHAQDWPMADKFAKRLEKGLPPGLLEKSEEKGGPPPIPPEVMQQMQQMQMQLQQAGQQIQEMGRERDLKMMEQATALKKSQIEADSKREIAEMEEATKLEIAKITSGTTENIQTLAQETLYLRSVLDQNGLSASGPVPGRTPGPASPEMGG